MAFFQEFSGGIFGEKNKQGIDRTPDKEVLFFQQPGYRAEKGGGPVYGKHQNGGAAQEPVIVWRLIGQSGKKDFQTKTGHAALNKCIFHTIQSAWFRSFYTE